MFVRWWHGLPVACMVAWGNLFDLPLIVKVKASLIHVEYEMEGIYTGVIDVLDLKHRMGLNG